MVSKLCLALLTSGCVRPAVYLNKAVHVLAVTQFPRRATDVCRDSYKDKRGVYVRHNFSRNIHSVVFAFVGTQSALLHSTL